MIFVESLFEGYAKRLVQVVLRKGMVPQLRVHLLGIMI